MKRKQKMRTRTVSAIGKCLGPFEVDTTERSWSSPGVKCSCGGTEFHVHKKGLTCKRGKTCGRRFPFAASN